MADSARKPRSFFKSSGLSIFNKARPPSRPSSPVRSIARETVLAALADPDTATKPTGRVGRPRKSAPTDIKEPASTSDDADHRASRLAGSGATSTQDLPIDQAHLEAHGDAFSPRLTARRGRRSAVEQVAGADMGPDSVGSSGSPKKRPGRPPRSPVTVARGSGRRVGRPPKITNIGPKRLGRPPKKDRAELTNGQLSVAMEKAMRVTISGNAAPYSRTITKWTVADSDRNAMQAASQAAGLAINRGAGRAKVRLEGKRRAVKVIVKHAGRSIIASGRGGGGKRKPGRPRKIVAKEESDAEDEHEVIEAPESPVPQAGPSRTPPGRKKEYMSAGFYCQDANAKSPFKLVSKVLKQREADALAVRGKTGRGKGKGKDVPPSPIVPKKRGRPPKSPAKLAERHNFPPLPYDHGHKHFFDQEHEFVLPFNISWEAENGLLDSKKKPEPFQKIRTNMFIERNRRVAAHKAVCHCDPESACGDNCINRQLQQFCGKDCPSGESCTNKSLTRRPTPALRVFYTGSRGFGLKAMENIPTGTFVIDYRGEIINLATFVERIQVEYKGKRNFYALAYDGDEVIDAGQRGNEARFINHGCNPNLEVRKYQLVGDGFEEYEVGMWASRDIKEGEELFYDYNFDSFAASADTELRTRCNCGAVNCVGFLGRKAGERSAKEIAVELATQAASEANKANLRAQRAQRNIARHKGKKRGGKRVVGQKVVVKSTKSSAEKKPSRYVPTGRPPGRPRKIVPEATAVPVPEPILPREDDRVLITLKTVKNLEEKAVNEVDQSQASPGAAQPHVARVSEARPAEEGTVQRVSRTESPSIPLDDMRAAKSSTEKWEPQPQELAGGKTPARPILSESSVEASIGPMTSPPTIAKSPQRSVHPSTASDAQSVGKRPTFITHSPFTNAPLPTDRTFAAVTPQQLVHRIDSHLDHSLPPSAQSTSSRSPEPSLRRQSSSGPMTPGSDSDALKRKSGWANWLKKQAGERARTLEDWHDLRIKRRRGVGWMNMMIQEYGLLDSPAMRGEYTPAGSEGSFKNTIAALGKGPLAEPEVRLGGPSLDKSKEAQRKRAIMAGMIEDGQDLPESDHTPTPPAIASGPGFAGLFKRKAMDDLPDEANKRNRGLQPRHSDSALLPAGMRKTSPSLGSASGWKSSAHRFWKPTSEVELSTTRPEAEELHPVSDSKHLQDRQSSRPVGQSAPTSRFSPPPIEPAIIKSYTSASDLARVKEALGPASTPSVAVPTALEASVEPVQAIPNALPEAVFARSASGMPDMGISAPEGPTNPSLTSRAELAEPTEPSTSKKKAIRARNGAPMGYAYVWEPIGAPAQPVAHQADEEGTSRRPRRSMPATA